MDDQTRLILWLFPTVLSSSSNGHRTMVYAIEKLVHKGYSCGVLVPSRSRFKKQSSLNLSDNVLLFKNSEPPARSSCVIASDTADVKLVDSLRHRGHRILWWLMAPPGLLDAPFPNIHTKDQVAIYSSFILPDVGKYCFMQDPSVYEELLRMSFSCCSESQRSTKKPKKRVGVYCGKGALRLLSPHLETTLGRYTELVPFDRYWPASRREYNNLVISLDGLICFDPLTAVILDVAAQGKPVYLPNKLFPASAYDGFPISFLRYAYSNEEKFIEHLLRESHTSIDSIGDFFQEIESANLNGLQCLIDSINELALEVTVTQSINVLAAQLKNYSDSLKLQSTIKPAMDGQAASSRLLHIYLWLIKLQPLFGMLSRNVIGSLFVLSDQLVGSKIGYVFLRCTIHLPWAFRSILLRGKWMSIELMRRNWLPTIRRSFFS